MRRRPTRRENPSLLPTVIGEFHFSPLEHAAFAELEEDADLDGLLDRLFPLAMSGEKI